MKTYLAGPISAHADWNAPAFRAEAMRLRALGHDVVNPLEVNDGLEHQGWAACMKRDLAVLITCDAIQMLQGWRASRGATLEHEIATALGLQVFYPESALVALVD
jgi:hypothetical protein